MDVFSKNRSQFLGKIDPYFFLGVHLFIQLFEYGVHHNARNFLKMEPLMGSFSGI
jgi:hypothetical protein